MRELPKLARKLLWVTAALVVGPGPHSHFSVEFECSGEVDP